MQTWKLTKEEFNSLLMLVDYCKLKLLQARHTQPNVNYYLRLLALFRSNTFAHPEVHGLACSLHLDIRRRKKAEKSNRSSHVYLDRKRK